MDGFSHCVTARFYQVDRAGIVFFGRVYEYCHDVLEELLATLFGSPQAIFEEKGFGMPLVHSEADYERPIRMGDRLEITVRVERVGRRSMTFYYDVSGEDGSRRATVRLVHAFVSMEDFTPIDVPGDLVAALDEMGLVPK